MQVIADPPGGGESFSKGEEGRYLRWGGVPFGGKSGGTSCTLKKIDAPGPLFQDQA